MSEQVAVAERPATVSENAAVVARVYDAFSQGDVATLFDIFHPAGTITQSSRLPWGGVYEGHEGLGLFLGRLTGAIRSSVETERFIDDEAGHVVAIGRTRGQVLATGRPFDVPEVHVWTVGDGKITRFEAYIDTAMMREALDL
jgi:ketosteroid isomerase-like protein